MIKRKFIIDEDCIHIQLASGKWTFASLEDEHLTQYNWYESAQGYAASRGKNWGCIKLMHQVIIPKYPSDKVIDHIDRNKLNNRRDNLRVVNRSTNFLNSDYKKPISSYTHGGVGIDRTHNTYKAYYSVAGKRVNVGTFKTYEEAEIARLIAFQKFLKETLRDNS